MGVVGYSQLYSRVSGKTASRRVWCSLQQCILIGLYLLLCLFTRPDLQGLGLKLSLSFSSLHFTMGISLSPEFYVHAQQLMTLPEGIGTNMSPKKFMNL